MIRREDMVVLQLRVQQCHGHQPCALSSHLASGSSTVNLRCMDGRCKVILLLIFCFKTEVSFLYAGVCWVLQEEDSVLLPCWDDTCPTAPTDGLLLHPACTT